MRLPARTVTHKGEHVASRAIFSGTLRPSRLWLSSSIKTREFRAPLLLCAQEKKRNPSPMAQSGCGPWRTSSSPDFSPYKNVMVSLGYNVQRGTIFYVQDTQARIRSTSRIEWRSAKPRHFHIGQNPGAVVSAAPPETMSPPVPLPTDGAPAQTDQGFGRLSVDQAVAAIEDRARRIVVRGVNF